MLSVRHFVEIHEQQTEIGVFEAWGMLMLGHDVYLQFTIIIAANT